MSSPQPPRPDGWHPPDPQSGSRPGPPPPPGQWATPYPPPGAADGVAAPLPSDGRYVPPSGGYAPPPGPQYPPPTYRVPRSGNRRRWGVVLTIVGAALLLAGLAMGLGFVRGIQDLVPSLDQTTRVSGTTSVTLAGDDMLILYAPDWMMPTCDILGPTAQVPDIDLGSTHYSFTVGGETYESIAKLGGPGEPGGEYLVECQQEGLILAPPLDVGGIVGSVFAMLGAVAAVTVGGTLLIVGLVLWLTARRNRE